jgi:hypothetical protein
VYSLDEGYYKDEKLCAMIFNKSAKSVFILRNYDYPMQRFICKQSPKLLNHVYVTFLMPLVLANFGLHSEFEKVIHLISSSGLLEFYVETMRWNRYTKNLILRDESTLKAFSLEDLKFGFIPWLCALLVSVVAFILEVLWFLMGILWKKIKTYLSEIIT